MPCHWSRSLPVFRCSGCRVGLLSDGPVRYRHKTRAAAGCRKYSVFVQPRGTRDGAFRIRPLLRTLLLQHRVTQPGDIQVAATRGFPMFVVDLFGLHIGKQARPIAAQLGAEPARKIHGDLPVVACLAGRRHGRTDARDPAFGVGDGAFLLAPGRRRQQHVGVPRRLGRSKCVLHHHALRAPERLHDARLVRHRLGRVGAGDPYGLDAALAQRFEHFDDGLARGRRKRGYAPEFRHLFPLRGIAEVAMGREQRRHAADFASAHRIGLTRQRKRPGPGAADVARRQMKVDERGILAGALNGLIESLAVHGQCRGGLAEHFRGGDDVIRRHATDRGGGARRVLGNSSLDLLETIGMGGNVFRIAKAFPQHHVQHRVEQRHVCAGQDGKMQVGGGSRIRAPRIDDDQAQGGIAASCGFNAPEQDRVRMGRVGACDENAVGVVDVLVAGRRRIGAQRGLVACDRRGHAQPRVGVDVVGADQRPRQFVEYVIVLGQKLARDVERHAVRAVRINDPGEPVRDEIHGFGPVRPDARRVAGTAQLGMQGSRLRVGAQVQGRALGAEAAEIGGMRRIAFHVDDAPRLAVHDYAAADAAVRTGGAGPLHRSGHSAPRRKPSCHHGGRGENAGSPDELAPRRINDAVLRFRLSCFLLRFHAIRVVGAKKTPTRAVRDVDVFIRYRTLIGPAFDVLPIPTRPALR